MITRKLFCIFQGLEQLLWCLNLALKTTLKQPQTDEQNFKISETLEEAIGPLVVRVEFNIEMEGKKLPRKGNMNSLSVNIVENQ